VAEPGERRPLVDGPDHRDHDRWQQNQETPEDEGMREPGREPLEQLALTEDDHRLVSDPASHVVRALDRRGSAQQPGE
jgi:hypothetical protein